MNPEVIELRIKEIDAQIRLKLAEYNALIGAKNELISLLQKWAQHDAAQVHDQCCM